MARNQYLEALDNAEKAIADKRKQAQQNDNPWWRDPRRFLGYDDGTDWATLGADRCIARALVVFSDSPQTERIAIINLLVLALARPLTRLQIAGLQAANAAQVAGVAITPHVARELNRSPRAINRLLAQAIKNIGGIGAISATIGRDPYPLSPQQATHTKSACCVVCGENAPSDKKLCWSCHYRYKVLESFGVGKGRLSRENFEALMR